MPGGGHHYYCHIEGTNSPDVGDNVIIGDFIGNPDEQIHLHYMYFPSSPVGTFLNNRLDHCSHPFRILDDYYFGGDERWAPFLGQTARRPI